MINVTDSAIVNKIKGTGRTFTLSIVVGRNTYTMVKSLKRSSIFASSQKLTVGETVSAFIEAEINGCRESLQNYEVEPILDIDDYKIPLGIFKVQAPSQADGSGTQKITAYDRMAETSKYTYTATGLTSAKSTFSAICSICGYTAVTSGLTDVSINDRLLDGMDCRKALGYIAGVFGKNCVVGTDGKFKMVGYSTVSEDVCKISIDSLDTLEFPSKVSTIDYFNAVVNDETAYKSGTGNNGVNVVNPLFTSNTQTSNILANLQSSVGGNGYYPAKFKQLNGDPRIEVGDVIKVEHRDILTGEVIADYVPVMSLTLDYDGGVTVSIEAYPTEAEFSMSLSDKVDFTNSSNNAKFEDINNKVDSFEKDIDGANTKADFATVRAKAVEELNDLISNSLGLYRTEIEGAGGDIKYYFHNAEDISDSNYIVAFTDKGFSVTNDWNKGNPSWDYGMNPAGNSIMNYLVVNKISADLIETGVIRSLDGAPVKTEFSLNTGLFSLEAQARKETFGFGVNRSNDLMLQYNYSDSEKQGVKLGYYYGGNFYKDSKYTELITPSTKYYYGDIPNNTFYEYSSNRYQKITDISVVAQTYKGFVLHARGSEFGYIVNADGSVHSDFNFGTSGILGADEENDDADLRTSVLKFYDLQKESADSLDHYTAIRKQSIVTKHLSAENIAFMFNGKLYDLGYVILNTSNLITSLSNEIDILKQEILNIKEELNVKSVLVYVTADPRNAGFVEGTGSYKLSDGSVPVKANAVSGSEYYISSVSIVRSNGEYSETIDQETLIDNGWLTSNGKNLNMPVPILESWLGDTINVVVNFAEPQKYRLTLNVEPAGSGTVSGAGLYKMDEYVPIDANPNTNYEFVGWYENNQLKYSFKDPVISINGNHTLTAKFKLKEPETPVEVATVRIVSNGAGSGDTVYLVSTPNGSSLGTSKEFTEKQQCYFHAQAGTGRKIVGFDFNGTYYTAEQIYEIFASSSPDVINASHTVLNFPCWVAKKYLGTTVTGTVYFDKADSGGGSGETVVITTSEYVKVYRNGVEITQTSGYSYTFNVGDRVKLEAASRSGMVPNGNWLINGSIVNKGDVVDFTSITTNDAGHYVPMYVSA